MNDELKNFLQHNPTTCPDPWKTPPEFRAAWVATVTNIDWPSKPGLPVDTQKQEFINILNQLQKMHMNAVVVQIKPTADAFYPSRYWPWSQYLTGIQGQNPGYDPLAFMLKEAHRRHISFHAWFNPYRVSMQDHLDQLASDNPARQHPDWIVSYGGKLSFDPGIPAARNFILDSIREVVRTYDIDAVHFDDYFYPYRVANQDFPDEATYQQYGAAHFLNKGDWRRNNVNLLLQELARTIKQHKPHVRVGISPFGVWRNKAVDSTGSDTQAGQTDYDDLYADTRTWIRRGWLDYIAPQIYWTMGFAPAAYDKLVPWWVNEVAGTNVHLYIGQAIYKIGSAPGPWSNPDEMPNQLQFNRQFKAVRGSIFFSMKDLLANRLGFTDRLISEIYTCAVQPDAYTPAMQQSAQDEWNSTAALFGGTAPRYDSGIAGAWRDLVFALKNPGPPLTQEYHSVDWSGKAIVVQEFARARCEWSAGAAHWYYSRGPMS